MILPVLFTQFDAVCQNADIAVLTWTTAQEENSAFFEIQRSEDGIHFSTIHKITAAGNSSNEKRYSFTDNDPQGNIFYRIAETDKDGVHTFTQVRHLDCGSKITSFNIWPNPVRQLLTVSIKSSLYSPAGIAIVNEEGRAVYSKQTNLVKGRNVFLLNVNKLPPGVYNMTVSWNNGLAREIKKIVKQ